MPGGSQARAARCCDVMAKRPKIPAQHRAQDPVIDSPIRTLAELAEAEAECTRCPLYEHATQAVPGEGRTGARLMLVGERPGDKEDLAGKPFVGPAGAILDRALADADIRRNTVFVTNAVKHFKFEPRGKRRLHKRAERLRDRTLQM